MAREFSRTERVADAVQRALAQLIQFEVRDPRVGMVNINDVEVSRDLALAKVYVTFVGRDTDAECEKGAEALNKAAGFLRSHLAKELNIRTTPRLQFVYDKTAVRGQALSSLIDKAVAEDRAHQSPPSSGDERGDT
ncbi:30S ribosome-binding factor RbfA [Exilibacterium tricleocarpae]|uniref:Ribosome-binding factor A n=1 Tax=Exilibacterium tricleocarpae TaxID=2591008 RepID=A0A545SZU6_9GAMM|nr:30S ribosome-binding factor RbfA [Exilibacterium tricleocarpae]TQV70504.1 30S ribosome-binding factor RbfA [Exilibacterium tricleocarpae]